MPHPSKFDTPTKMRIKEATDLHAIMGQPVLHIFTKMNPLSNQDQSRLAANKFQAVQTALCAAVP